MSLEPKSLGVNIWLWAFVGLNQKEDGCKRGLFQQVASNLAVPPGCQDGKFYSAEEVKTFKQRIMRLPKPY